MFINKLIKKKLIMLPILLTSSLIYGILIGKAWIFPHDQLQFAWDRIFRKYGKWSIGIYEGETPFKLFPKKEIKNPILTGRNVNDVDARFVADPFMIIEEDYYHMFFEVGLRNKSPIGDIGYAKSNDGQDWEYVGIILDEKFHLSYPNVFKWGGEFFMVPETGGEYEVKLYKARNFPYEWENVSTLIEGYRYIDPTIFYHKNKWWMFLTDPSNGVLNLYFSHNLYSGWKSHPMNPIIKNNKNISRPAGKVFKYNDSLYRLAQDDEPSYGISVNAFEIIHISEKSYSEKPASEYPLVTKSNRSNKWNAAGMHHLDLHKIGDRWIGIVDGRQW